jgi:hypothetical protein
MSAKHRGSGTVAFGGLARSVITAAELREPRENRATHAVAVAKCNLYAQPQALGYIIRQSDYNPEACS